MGGGCGHSWTQLDTSGGQWPGAPPRAAGWLCLSVCTIIDVVLASLGVKGFHNLLVTFPILQLGWKPSFFCGAVVSTYLQDVQMCKMFSL